MAFTIGQQVWFKRAGSTPFVGGDASNKATVVRNLLGGRGKASITVAPSGQNAGLRDAQGVPTIDATTFPKPIDSTDTATGTVGPAGSELGLTVNPNSNAPRRSVVVAQGATLTGSTTAPFVFSAAGGETFILSVNGGADQTKTTIAGTAGVLTGSTTETFDFSPAGSETLIISINGGSDQTFTFPDGSFAAPAAATLAEVRAVIDATITGAVTSSATGALRITSSTKGTGSSVTIKAGTANTILGFTTSQTNSGTGDFANYAVVVIGEVVTKFDFTGVTESSASGALKLVSNTTGPDSTLLVGAGTANATLGFTTAQFAQGVTSESGSSLSINGIFSDPNSKALFVPTADEGRVTNSGFVPNAPVAALAGVGAGSVTSGTHSYKVTVVTSLGQSLPSAKSNVVTTTGGNGKVNVTIPLGPPSTTARKIYRTVAGDVGAWKLVTTVSNNTTTLYLDNIADGSLTTNAPIAETFTLNTIGNIDPNYPSGRPHAAIASGDNVPIGGTQDFVKEIIDVRNNTVGVRLPSSEEGPGQVIQISTAVSRGVSVDGTTIAAGSRMYFVQWGASSASNPHRSKANNRFRVTMHAEVDLVGA